ncbi:thiolase family protein [Staphylococcus argensis]|uniref:Putative acetyl-CoA C-acetyltransferase VraB n=1 Tax=Staphylococcus argensis TaxID=1607738 RepID=A0A2K4FDA2_9STAP|nr:thiolase family protein [Staphylococcus argensis]MCY6990885.1 thiolase family protein [Staphylococcus argensis]POA09263.1 acetyl-CoA C-acyltransferase [Staphylococcus argensis]
MNKPVIVAAKRTPFGKYGGALRTLEPDMLLKPLLQHLIEQCPELKHRTDDVILGNVVGNGGNIARKSLLEAGLSETIPGVTLDRQCGSGLEAILYACRMIQAGAGQIYLAGGVESTSRAPWKIKRPQSVYDTAMPEVYERASFAPEGQDPSMIEAAENVAQHYAITREAQDHFAYQSHQRTMQAYEEGHLVDEILPLTVKGQRVDMDESVKPRLRMKLLARMKPLLPGGTVTAGNCCMKNDGAVILLVMEEHTAQALGYHHGLQFVDGLTKGVDPTLLGIGPIPTVETLLERNQTRMKDIEAVELNEAFASQVLACQRELGISEAQLNRWGGAIATGHPYGASGAALVTRLFNMNCDGLTLATMGIGGGMGNAILFRPWT